MVCLHFCVFISIIWIFLNFYGFSCPFMNWRISFLIIFLLYGLLNVSSSSLYPRFIFSRVERQWFVFLFFLKFFVDIKNAFPSFNSSHISSKFGMRWINVLQHFFRLLSICCYYFFFCVCFGLILIFHVFNVNLRSTI